MTHLFEAAVQAEALIFFAHSMYTVRDKKWENKGCTSEVQILGFALSFDEPSACTYRSRSTSSVPRIYTHTNCKNAQREEVKYYA